MIQWEWASHKVLVCLTQWGGGLGKWEGHNRLVDRGRCGKWE